MTCIIRLMQNTGVSSGWGGGRWGWEVVVVVVELRKGKRVKIGIVSLAKILCVCLVISMWCKCAKTGSVGIETRVSVYSQLTLSVQRVSNEKRLPTVVITFFTRTIGYGVLAVVLSALGDFSKLLWHEVLGRGGADSGSLRNYLGLKITFSIVVG